MQQNDCGRQQFINRPKKLTSMALNKSTGNMYAFVSHTYNPMKGECEHSCAYCFMRRKLLLPPLRLELKELKVNLGKGNFIFVGSSTDEWAANVPSECVRHSR
jgi:DNA repair photolyase